MGHSSLSSLAQRFQGDGVGWLIFLIGSPRAPPIPLHWFPMTKYGFQILLGFLGIYRGRKTGPL